MEAGAHFRTLFFDNRFLFIPVFFSFCRILFFILMVYVITLLQHIFNENAVPPCRIIYQNVGHCAHQLSILNDRTAAHE